MPVPPANLTTNDDGSVDLDVRMHFQNPFDINTTGIGTITVLPDETTNTDDPTSAIAQFLPLFGTGPAGLTPKFDQPTYHEVPWGTALPSPSYIRTLVDPGDPNATPAVPPTWHDEIWVHAGPDGAPGTPVDLEALANVTGTPLEGGTVVYRGADGLWHVEQFRVPTSADCTAFTDATGNVPNQKIGQLVIPSRAWAQRGEVEAVVQINPASDTSGGITHINLIARLGDVNNGPIIGFGPGLDTASPFLCHLLPTPAAQDVGNQIAAGTPGTVHLIAQQTNASTLSNWSTTTAGAVFHGNGLPIV